MNTYEIYTYNSQPIVTGVYAGKQPGEVSGWEIKHVITDKDITTYPFFDCVITKNDIPVSACETF